MLRSAPVKVCGCRPWRTQPHAPTAGVGKPAMHEVAGDGAPTVQRALWRFDREAGGGGARSVESAAEKIDGEAADRSHSRLGAAGQAGRSSAGWGSISHVGASARIAGPEPALCNGGIAPSMSVTRHHEVSILIAGMVGADRCLGSQPGAKVSMMSMRPPQHGQGRGSTQG
jgi:hypothetical protein